jgi:cell wall-associated NlpC family hydrolase
MKYRRRIAITALFCAMLCVIASAEGQGQQPVKITRPDGKRHRKHGRTLDSDERLAVLAAALDSKIPRYAEGDCSHLVHAIYERAGFPYEYADSDQLYDGVGGFERVSKPEPGDLVVWRGHAGIVVRPSRHVFYSFLHAGPGTDDYESRYWRGRGQARFYRYVKNAACAGCTLARKTE